MNYPLWSPPLVGGRIVIGIIAILHVFVSHFAVGGGLFLPLTKRKAYRENNPALLDYVKSHSKFFVLVVLVGYYAVYGFNLQQNALGPRAAWLILGAVVAFVLVAFIFTQNMTAMLQPQDFYTHFLNKGVGTALGSVTASRMARLLHFLAGALAVSR